MVPFIMALINRFGWLYAYLAIAGLTALLLVLQPALWVRNKPEDLVQLPDGGLDPDAVQSRHGLVTTVAYHLGINQRIMPSRAVSRSPVPRCNG